MRERKRIVVIGNGMASHSFCRWMTTDAKTTNATANDTTSLTDDAQSSVQLIVFGDEPRPAYDRVHLTDFFDGKSAQDLELAPRGWYTERNIELRTGQRVEAINRQEKTVRISGGKTIAYDKLVIATGSKPFVPPIPGVEQPGVFVYRTIEDLEQIQSWGSGKRAAAVLGGGLLGLEAAKALRDMQLIPHVIEMAPALMPRQLDRDSGQVLQRRIERMGVHIHLTRRTQSIERHGDFLIVRFDNGDSIAVDMVVISAGIRPRDELARAAELEIGERGGIVVNDGLRTSDPHIYAIGECACHRETVYGLVGPCYQMAKALSLTLRGERSEFVGADQSARLKLVGVDVATFGAPLGQAAGAKVVAAPTNGSSRRLLIRDGRLIGAIGVGEWPEVERIRAAVTESRKLRNWQLRRFRKTGEVWRQEITDDVTKWPPQALICSCLQVQRSDLTTACQRGCDTIEKLAEQTGASTVCGSCRPLLAQMVGKADEARDSVVAWRGLFVVSMLALLCILAIWTTGPIPFSESVLSPRHRLDFLWRDDFWKQVSGYSLLTVTVLSLLLSLRKRWKRINLGSFGTWRMAHGLLGLTTLGGVLAHTGFHMGSNLNYWLMVCFVGINLVGAFTGAITSLESRVSGPSAMALRQWRPRITFLHILFFWPLPLLIAAHIFSIYYY